MKKEKGIAFITLIFVIIITGVVIFSAVKYAGKYVDNQKTEDRKNEMLSIQTVITNIQNKHTVDEEANPLVGEKLELENNTTGYNITDELKQKLTEQEDTNLYILTKEDLENNGISNIEINENEFYIVDYNSSEVYFSVGIEGKYKLSDM